MNNQDTIEEEFAMFDVKFGDAVTTLKPTGSSYVNKEGDVVVNFVPGRVMYLIDIDMEDGTFSIADSHGFFEGIPLKFLKILRQRYLDSLEDSDES